MRLIFSLAFGAQIFSCDSHKEQNSTGRTKDTIEREIPPKAKSKKSKLGLIVSRDNIKIYGDTTSDQQNPHLFSIRFEPYISFDDFKEVETRKYAKAEIDFKSNASSYYFGTRITAAYASDTANFAGHYTFASWGCGSPCQAGVIIDRKTGKIYDAPSASLGYYFRADSRMLVTNPPDSTGFYEDCFIASRVYICGTKKG